MKESVFLWHACLRKQIYNSKKSALGHLKKIKKRGLALANTANAYNCRFCGNWHLGHRKEKNK